MGEKRDLTCVVCRVTAMLMIVLCHSIKYIDSIPGSKQLAPLLAFGVEIFLFISGFLYSEKRPESYTKWFAKSFVKLQIPVVIWVTVWCIAFIFTNTGFSFLQYISYVINYQGLGWIHESLTPPQLPDMYHLWFPTVIFICYLLLPLLNKIKSFLIKHAVVSIIVLTAVSISAGFLGIRFAYFYIFITGYIIGLLRKEKQLIIKPIKGIVLSSVWFVLWIAVFIIGNRFYHDSNFYIYTCWLNLACAFTLWFFTVISNISARFPTFIYKITNFKVVKAFEQYSYYIYITHCSLLLSKYNPFELLSNDILAFFIFLIYTLISAFLLKCISDPVIKLINRFFSKNHIKEIKNERKLQP